MRKFKSVVEYTAHQKHMPALLGAVRVGDLDQVKASVAAGALPGSLWVQWQAGVTNSVYAPRLAIECQQPKVLHYFLKDGTIDPNSSESFDAIGNTLLLSTIKQAINAYKAGGEGAQCFRDTMVCMRLLMDAGAELSTKNVFTEETPIALLDEHLEIKRALNATVFVDTATEADEVKDSTDDSAGDSVVDEATDTTGTDHRDKETLLVVDCLIHSTVGQLFAPSPTEGGGGGTAAVASVATVNTTTTIAPVTTPSDPAIVDGEGGSVYKI